MKHSKDYYVKELGLLPHPEGGYYKEMYRSQESIAALPVRYAGSRNFGTSIYFLLGSKDRSKFHRLQSDEIWYFLDGAPVDIHMIFPDGHWETHRVGLDLAKNEHPQVLIPQGTWFAAKIVTGGEFVLVGCAVFPGFDFTDFELADETLVQAFPQHEARIREFI